VYPPEKKKTADSAPLNTTMLDPTEVQDYTYTKIEQSKR
jgi:hypothetical protein